MGIIDKLLETVFPSGIYCISCGSMINGSRDYALCDSCMAQIHWVGEHSCSKCGKILEEDYRHELCRDCMTYEHDFDRGFTCVQYGLLERGVLMDFKYRDKSYIGRKLGEIMYDRIRIEETEYDLVVPVPLYKARQIHRGYNQAAIMASVFSKLSGYRCAPDLLVRSRRTKAMKGLGSVERYENLKNAFAVSHKNHYTIAGKRVLLIDDIYTTGSTLDACSRVLKEAGASRVDVLTFACGANIPPKI